MAGGIVGLAVLAVLAVLLVAAVPDNTVYLFPQHSTAPFRDTIEVQLWANTTDTFGAGQINLTYIPGCAQVTQVAYGPSWQGTWDTRFDGREWLVFLRPLGQPTVSGTVLIGTLTIQCCTASGCVTPLSFSPPSKLNDPSVGDLAVTWTGGTVTCPTPALLPVFDTGEGNYPSIAGRHKGTIQPNETITVQSLYTYNCAGTGGHTAYAAISSANGTAEAQWNGYTGDWHTITFDRPFTLHAQETYNYTLVTGSYPQIVHSPSHTATGGVITCEEFVDRNGQRHEGWIPAIRLQ
ncbi:MAG TPA: hypothetical protein ENN68_01065 [Methanomicrobia archaeon]|nr:hypothetical protein [Methanomicrobia archaeon]